ncbi:hypothetical protein KEM52_004112 [Ascosphaera acerosa]|nr:hypothetical protein KEM52_004112 [Ascosphaera acerosa]
MHSQQVPEIRVSEGQSMSEDIDLPRDLRVQATSPKAVDESAQYITSPPHTMTEHDLHMAESPKVVTLDQELGTTHLDDSIADPTVNKRASFITPPDGYQLDQRRLSSNGIRPLPPMDPNETPAQRASRIRSFYKEYFDPNNAKTKSQYYGDLEDAPVDSVYGAENVPPMPQDAPYAQPMPRRAMTPPPRMPSEAFAPPQALRNGWDSRPSSRGSNIKSPSIRVQSSVSNRFGPTPPPPRREKKRPPPEPLQMIPTPHAIRDDTLITINPIDFAPAQLTKAQREGRPMTPQSGARVPYLPQLPAHIPLVSAYDDLAVMPSPHNLRKSGTYTALDFAPPPKFHNDLSRPGSPLVPPSGFSDSGSLRSPSAAGSRAGAMSPAAAMTIRNGGNRVSRLPQDVVGTVDSMNAELKPKWDMR